METEAREEKNSTFSYNLVCPLFRCLSTYFYMWSVIEKGFEKSNNPEEQIKISYDIIELALSQMREHINITPCYQLTQLLSDRGFNIFLKNELYQSTNSVKARGAVYSLLQLSNKQKRKGVITISTGNFAHSLCYFGKELGIPVTVVMPISTPIKKTFQMHLDYFEATVCLRDNIVEAHKEALRIAKERGLVYIDGNDHPNMIIGQATLGIEILESLTNVDAVILPTSVYCCGLTAGIAVAIKECNPDIQVIEVQHAAPDLSINFVRRESLFNNELDIPVTKYTWYNNDRGIVQSLFDTIVTVSNTFVQIAAKFLQQKGNVTDFNAAIGIAAIISGQLDELKGKRTVIPVFGKMDSYVELIDNK